MTNTSMLTANSRAIGPYEASLRSQAIAARRRLTGADKPRAVLAVSAPIIVRLPPPAVEIVPVEPVPPATGLSLAKVVIAQVAAKHRLRASDITGKSRQRAICHARWECGFIMVVEHGLSLEAAGRRLNVDHSSVLYGMRSHLRMHAEQMSAYASYLSANSTSCSSIHREISKLYFEDGWKVAGIAKELSMTRLEVEAIIKADVRGIRRASMAEARKANA